MSEIVNGAQINETHANVSRSRSTFPLKQLILDTHRFGEYHPHFVLDGITSDKHPIRSSHQARSYTLKAPLMQDIQMHKDYFLIPLRAILPLQSDRIFTNPTIGDDVPSDAYCSVSDFLGKIGIFVSTLESSLSSLWSASPYVPSDSWTLYFKYLVFLESIFSNGSLLSSLGCNLSLNAYMRRADNQSGEYSIDEAFDLVCSSFRQGVNTAAGGTGYFTVTIDSTTYTVATGATPLTNYFPSNLITFREFLMRIRDTADWSIVSFVSGYTANPYGTAFGFECVIPSGSSLDLDLSKLWAYHLVCAEFYSNDKVDYIYSAELFRQYIRSLYSSSWATTTFSWNGLSLQYDFLSAKYFNDFVSRDYSSLTSSIRVRVLQYFLVLFGYQRSLRFKDYFTGSRTRPLAVGASSGSNSTNVPVVSNQVSVVDVSRSIQVQRFLNAVNATGRKFEEYLKGIFGVAPSPDHHSPLFLAHSSDSLFASEVENTGVAQQQLSNSVTAVFRGNGNQFEYSVEVDEPSIILGLTSYDFERSYAHGIERSFLIKDRFDMFLPQLQYVGDQDVKGVELRSNYVASTFGYQFRDMHFKQLVNRASGGFAADVLPGYAFVFNPSRFAYNPPTISPDFIRSKCSELDEFYLNLTGHSLGTYFHFIVLTTNIDNASRPMAYNPQILG